MGQDELPVIGSWKPALQVSQSMAVDQRMDHHACWHTCKTPKPRITCKTPKPRITYEPAEPSFRKAGNVGDALLQEQWKASGAKLSWSLFAKATLRAWLLEGLLPAAACGLGLL